MQADHEIGRRAGLARAGVEHLQSGFGLGHDGIDDGTEAVKGFVLHPHDGIADAFRHQPLRRELFAAEADDQDLAAEIRIECEVLQGADRHHRIRRGDRDAAAIGMRQRHDVVDIGIFRQELGADALHRIFHRALDALHGRGDAEDVLGAHRTVGIAKALERKTFEWRQRRRHRGRDLELVERRRVGHADARLVDPFAGQDRRQRMADHLAIADDRRGLGDVLQRGLVSLRHESAQGQAAAETRAGGQAEIIHDDRDIVARVELDVAGLLVRRG